MYSRLPATQQDALSMSKGLSLLVNTIFKSADLFGFWKYPAPKAAADFEEMGLLDKIYWAYKSKKPIARVEKGSHLEKIFKPGPGQVGLPEGFTKKKTVTLGAVGDLIAVKGLENSKDLLYDEIADLVFDKDISYANLESQLTGQEIGDIVFSKNETPPLCCSAEQFQAVKGHRGKKFTLVHTACNHTLDMGQEGIDTTLDHLQKEGILDLGTNRDKEERGRGRIIEKNGIKIGFVSATFGLNGKPLPQDKAYRVNVVKFHSRRAPLDLSLLGMQIDYCKAQNCDFIVASLHWGHEYEFFPRKTQVEVAHQLVEAGVDTIIAHHSHVIQPVEYYRPRRDPQRVVPIVYSLGNLTSSFSAPHLVLSWVLNLTLAKGTHSGKGQTLLEHFEMVPVMQTEDPQAAPPVIRIRKFYDLWKQCQKNGSKEEKSYLGRAAGYIDLVLGGQ